MEPPADAGKEPKLEEEDKLALEEEEAKKGRGWRSACWLAKKLAFATTAVVCTPVLLPPLCVAAALSAPFCVLLAGAVATEKVMSGLLPLSQHPKGDEADEKEDLEEEEEPLEEVRRGAEKGAKEVKKGKKLEDEPAAEAVANGEKVVGFGAGEAARAEEPASVEGAEEKAENEKPEPVAETAAPVVNEALYTEEKMWDQIKAIRTIVGYEAALQASYVDELKALYVFTGVEPPILLKEDSDLMDVGDKLRFLKSVVGVV